MRKMYGMVNIPEEARNVLRPSTKAHEATIGSLGAIRDTGRSTFSIY